MNPALVESVPAAPWCAEGSDRAAATRSRTMRSAPTAAGTMTSDDPHRIRPAVTVTAATADTTAVAELAVVPVVPGDPGAVTLITRLHAWGWPGILALATAWDTPTVVAVLDAGARGYVIGAQPATGFQLSSRETQVLQLAADGCPDSEIAATLNIDTTTVKTHLQRVADELDTGGRRAELVLAALRHGLIT